MHLVRTKEEALPSERRVGGVTGWLIEWAHAVWLETTMRRKVKKQMCVIETLPIGGRKQLLLVSCAGEQFLVGTGTDSVQTIVHVCGEKAGEARSNSLGFGDSM